CPGPDVLAGGARVPVLEVLGHVDAVDDRVGGGERVAAVARHAHVHVLQRGRVAVGEAAQRPAYQLGGGAAIERGQRGVEVRDLYDRAGEVRAVVDELALARSAVEGGVVDHREGRRRHRGVD